ncbi:MAG: hypothetical protein IBX54_10565 [Rhodoferax sp.]|nr:hypothetical protein [Rhodoferax sp.]
MTSHTKLLAFILVASVSGCAIHQRVDPVAQLDDRAVCLVKNPAVRETFGAELSKALRRKDLTVREVAAPADEKSCPVVVTFTANWRWDLAMYMSYAEINVLNNGKPTGKAVYDATRGGGNMSKFIQAKAKINELVDQLFPGSTKKAL